MSDDELIALIERDLPPYARNLAMQLHGIEHGAPVLALDFDNSVEGRPGFLHGGAIGGLLEVAGFAALRALCASEGRKVRLKPINLSVEYLRGAVRERTYAYGRINRAGRRNANIVVEAWQSDRSAPVAEAVMNILIVPV
jgi:uncharacterized protein (TIGR00369 family)